MSNQSLKEAIKIIYQNLLPEHQGIKFYDKSKVQKVENLIVSLDLIRSLDSTEHFLPENKKKLLIFIQNVLKLCNQKYQSSASEAGLLSKPIEEMDDDFVNRQLVEIANWLSHVGPIQHYEVDKFVDEKLKLPVDQAYVEQAVKAYNKDWRVIEFKKIPFGRAVETFTIIIDDAGTKRELILKANMDSWRIEKAQYCYELIRDKTDIPVPDIIHADPKQRTLLMQKVGDGNLAEEFKKLNPSQQKDLVYLIGQYVGELHTITFPSFGFITKDGISATKNQYAPPYKTWIEFVYPLFLDKLKRAEPYFKDHVPKIRTFLEKNINLLNINISPCFLHDDLNCENFMISQGNVAAIIDMDRCMTGHNEYDLQYARIYLFNPARLGNVSREHLFEIFLKGYLSKNSIAEGFENRQKVYDMLHLIRLVSDVEGMMKTIPGFDLKQFQEGTSVYIEETLRK